MDPLAFKKDEIRSRRSVLKHEAHMRGVHIEITGDRTLNEKTTTGQYKRITAQHFTRGKVIGPMPADVEEQMRKSGALR